MIGLRLTWSVAVTADSIERSVEEGETSPASRGLGTEIHELFKPLGGVELDIPPRAPLREPPTFD